MVWAFSSYMLVKGLGQIVKLKPGPALAWGALLAATAFMALRGPVARLAARQANDTEGVNRLFIAPVVGAAALTVIVASQMGLPISTTHATVGAVFGVGFLREGLKRGQARRNGAAPGSCATLVQRSAVWRIVAAWLITVPATALLAAALFKAPQWLR